jgi:hypothetical protein
MTIPALRVVLSLTLFAAAAVMWQLAGVARTLADAHDRIATLDFDGVEAVHGASDGWLSSRLGELLDSGGSSLPRTADYWRGRYDALVEGGTGADAKAMQLAANGLFRRAQRASGGAPLSPDMLEQTLQAYAAVLRQDGSNRDAAYNYEYVARLRDRVQRGKAAPAPAVTIHGRPGADPPRPKGEEFEILTPMDYGDREAQPEPTPGRKLPRKG